MKVKDGVLLAGLKLPMRMVLIHADMIWKKYGQELVVTSTLDGVHSPGSLHPYGYAVDLRTFNFIIDTIAKVAKELRNALGEDYDVVIHETHIHVEYQKILE